jgi:hypothetical protein
MFLCYLSGTLITSTNFALIRFFINPLRLNIQLVVREEV